MELAVTLCCVTASSSFRAVSEETEQEESMTEEKTRLQKMISIILVAMMVAFGVLNLISRLNKGVTFEDALLRRTVAEERTVYSGTAYGEPVTITVSQNDGGNLTEVVYEIGNRIQDVCLLERGLPEIRTHWGGSVEGIRIHKNGALLFEGGYDFDAGTQAPRWYKGDGSTDVSLYLGVSVTAGSDYWRNYETSPQSVMRFALGPDLVCRGSFGVYLMLVLFTLLLLLDVNHPVALFRLQHCCDVRDPEPTDFYLAMQRVGWVLYPFLLLAGYIVALRMLP